MTIPLSSRGSRTIQFLLAVLLGLLIRRTRELWLRVLVWSEAVSDRAESLNSEVLPVPLLPRNVLHQQNHRSMNASEEFLAKLEEMDGPLSESLRILLGSTVTDHAGRHTAEIDQADSEARCQRYGLQLSKPLRRRRIFWGSLIADDSWHVLALAATEYHDLFDTIVFVESNATQINVPRAMRFAQESPRKQLVTSPLLWGNQTRVHVDYYLKDDTGGNGLGRENLQRGQIFKRWKENGMTYEDIGFLSDVDEVATRDFLLALQVCQVPEFQPTGKDSTGNDFRDCIRAKISSSSACFEGTPLCMQVPRRYGRPDWVIGECIEGIGDPTQHPQVPRKKVSAPRERIYNWTRYVGNVTDPTTNVTTFVNGPLWDATDFRLITLRRMSGTTSHGYTHFLPTGYQFHNFFVSLKTLRFKYETYGHPKKGASHIPLAQIQPNDVGFMVDCLTGRSTSGSKWRQPGPADWKMTDPLWGTPIAFKKVPRYIHLRHKEFQQELAQDELLYPPNISIVLP